LPSDARRKRRPRVVPEACCVVLALAALTRLAPALRASSKRERAAEAYERALEIQARLEAKPLESRSFKDYKKLLKAFDLVYRIDPGYPKTPSALTAEAITYQEMARAFSSDRYCESAIEMYQFLADQYPGSALARDALFTIGEIYRIDLENPEEAQKAYTRFLDRYPGAAKAREARARLQEVDRRLAAARAAERAPNPRAPASLAASEAASPGRLSEVNDVHFWEGSNYTRIVVTVGDEARFETVRLGNPDRIVLDLPNTRLGRALAGKAFPVGNGFLRQIRVAQFRPDVTRVVLDLDKIEDYSVFSLPNPFRLIIDIHGPPQPAILRSSLPARGGTAPAANGQAPETDASAGGFRQFPAATRASNPEAQPAPTDPVTVSGTPAATPAAKSSAPRSIDTSTTTETTDTVEGIRTPAPTSSGSTTLTRALGLKIARIVIDPGHGGHDTGTIGPTGLEEKDVVLDVAMRLKRLIERRQGSEVVMTRSDDTFIPLEERTAIANQRSADLFISIHANASSDASARGIEVYYLNFTSDPNSLAVAARENATSQESVHQLQTLVKKIVLSEKIEESAEFARQVDDSLSVAAARSGNHQPNRGLKKAPFVVLIGANMPSVLAEISFLTNPRDERLLRQPLYRQKIAEGLYRGIAGYVSNLGGVRIAERSLNSPPTSDSQEAPHTHERHKAASSTEPSTADPPDFY
jgi:N-acetylmuramoyl-L-alanine amidase